MQVDTYCPRQIRDNFSGDVWWYSRWDRRYHRRAGDAGKAPSDFFDYNGRLAAYYEEISYAA